MSRARRKRLKQALRRPFEWLGIALGVAVLCPLPRRALLAVADFASAVMYALDRTGRRHAEENLRIIFNDEELDAKRTARIVRRSYRNMARTIAHAFWTLADARRRVASAGEMSATGRAFLAANRPAVTVSGHIGCWEILSQLAFLEGHPMMSVAKDIGTGGMTHLLMKARRSIGQEIVHADGAFRPLMAGLKAGKSLGLLVDQAVRPKDGGVWVRFFGRPVPVSAAPAFFAAKGKAPIAVAWSRPLKDGRYRCEVVATYTPDQARDVWGMTQRCIRDLEGVIRRHPSCWLLSYNAFRKHPKPDELAKLEANERKAAAAFIAEAQGLMNAEAQRRRGQKTEITGLKKDSQDSVQAAAANPVNRRENPVHPVPSLCGSAPLRLPSLKVMQLVPAMEQGGVERGVVEMNRVLVGAGWENVVVSAGGRLAAQIEQDGGRHVTLDVKSKNPLTYLRRAAALRRLLVQEKPDVVCAHSRVPAWLFVGARVPIPWITFAHGANSVSWYSRVMTRGDVTVCPSRYIADYLKAAYNIKDEKLRVIPRAIDRERFDPARLDAAFVAEKRAAWGVEGRTVVMGVGRITQLKGYDILIRAVAQLPERFKLVIVGEAEELRKEVEADLRRLVGEVGATGRVVFAGNQRKVAECLSLADVVVSSNVRKAEAFGRSMAEALAMGKPVVAKAFGGALDIVRPGENGELVDEGTPEEFAAAIAKAADAHYGDLRADALERFSFARMAEASLAVYRELSRKEKNQ